MSNNKAAYETAKFNDLKNLLRTLNEIHLIIYKNNFVEYKDEGENILIYGNPNDLAILLALLQKNTSDYTLIMENNNGTTYIRAFNYKKI